MIFLLFFSLNAFADCSVFVPAKSFDWAGYTIRFDFSSMLEAKVYTEVSALKDADYILTLEGSEQPGDQFVYATSSMKLTRVSNGAVVNEARSSHMCWTQSCAVSDFAKVFKRTYNDLNTKLKPCAHQ